MSVKNFVRLFFFVLLLNACKHSSKHEKLNSSLETEKTLPADSLAQDFVQNDTLNLLSDILKTKFKQDSMIYWTKGDVNADKIQDFVVVLQDLKPDTLTGDPDSYTRKLVLLQTLDKYPNLKIRAVNDKGAIGCSNCGGAGVGDPFGDKEITIKDNMFSISELYGTCDKTAVLTTFVYDKKQDDWFLYKIERDDYRCIPDENNDEIEIKHTEQTQKDFGKIRFVDYSNL